MRVSRFALIRSISDAGLRRTVRCRNVHAKAGFGPIISREKFICLVASQQSDAVASGRRDFLYFSQYFAGFYFRRGGYVTPPFCCMSLRMNIVFPEYADAIIATEMIGVPIDATGFDISRSIFRDFSRSPFSASLTQERSASPGDDKQYPRPFLSCIEYHGHMGIHEMT